jgi:2-oxoglutarate ferredoxin oxidoreductase subunit alpha
MVQRLGPSTGGATQGAQGDILLTEFCTSGGYTIPVLCPSTPLECYELTVLAFSWAELLRTPVVILADKEVGMITESVNYDQLQLLHSADRICHSQPPTDAKNKTKTYDFSRLSDVPKFSPVGGGVKVTATGSAHNKAGELKKNDAETLEVLHHLEEKIRRRKDGLAIVKRDVQPDADTLVISYGITARAMDEAIQLARKEGKKVSGLHILSLFPISEKQILGALGDARRVVIAEENLSGQYRSVIAHLMRNQEVIGVNKIGSMITPKEIMEAIL